MSNRPKIVRRERRIQQPARKIAGMNMRRPGEILQLVILEKTVVSPVIQRNENERNGKTRSNLRQPRAPSKIGQ